MLDQVDHYETSDLSETQRAALRLTDAYLVAPGAMTDESRDAIARELTPDQIVETVLKVMGFASDKAMVALGLDFDEIRLFDL
jgi:alkylhydroperoxidase family enzyme